MSGESLNYTSTPINGVLDNNVKSFTVHEITVNDGAPKRICCNLAPPRVVRTLQCGAWSGIETSGDGWSADGVFFRVLF